MCVISDQEIDQASCAMTDRPYSRTMSVTRARKIGSQRRTDGETHISNEMGTRRDVRLQMAFHAPPACVENYERDESHPYRAQNLSECKFTS